VGGVAVGAVTVPVGRGRVRSQEIRAAITAELGFELCRAAVREGLIGGPLDDEHSLRARLRARASQARERRSPAAALGLAPALELALGPDEPLLLLARRPGDPAGTSACRRAELPADAASALLDAAQGSGEPVVAVPATARAFARVFYAPELVRPARPARPALPARLGAGLARRARGVLRAALEASSPSQVRRERIVRTVELACAARDPRAVPAVATERLPILLYHRVTAVGGAATGPYRVRPEALEEHLRFLSEAGYYTIGLETWRRAMTAATPLPGRAIVLTFDGAYEEILTEVWPLLRRYGFLATVFVTAETVGRRQFPDDLYGERVTYLGWRELRRLQAGGVELGSLSYSTRPLTALSPAAIVGDACRSRTLLERNLRRPVRAFAYPHGHTDPSVQHWIGACGYTFGLSCRSARSSFADSLLDLPCIEVLGTDRLAELSARLLQW
jgi:peptidoglycan/xylan/chitin deacetylase (PgdA/CDA1 family)